MSTMVVLVMAGMMRASTVIITMSEERSGSLDLVAMTGAR